MSCRYDRRPSVSKHTAVRLHRFAGRDTQALFHCVPARCGARRLGSAAGIYKWEWPETSVCRAPRPVTNLCCGLAVTNLFNGPLGSTAVFNRLLAGRVCRKTPCYKPFGTKAVQACYKPDVFGPQPNDEIYPSAQTTKGGGLHPGSPNAQSQRCFRMGSRCQRARGLCLRR